MSISLPNGTLLAGPSSSTVQYTAAVTRILHLANFSAELKTRDLQAMFREYESDKGGFRIKWLDDINALVVFADAAVAKRAYLFFLLHPPHNFHGQIRPYDKPDAAQIIQSLAARTLGHRGSSSNATSSFHQLINGTSSASDSFSALPPQPQPPQPQLQHHRAMSTSSAYGTFPSSMGPPPVTSSGLTPKRASISSASVSGGAGGVGPPNASARHTRTGSNASGGSFSLSGGSSGSRQPLTGVLNFNSGGIGRLATHRESGTTPVTSSFSRSAPRPSAPINQSASSSDTEPTITMDPPGLGSSMHGGASFGNWKMNSGSTGGSGERARRESMSAEKALREVQKAMASASVDVHG